MCKQFRRINRLLYVIQCQLYVVTYMYGGVNFDLWNISGITVKIMMLYMYTKYQYYEPLYSQTSLIRTSSFLSKFPD